MNSQVYSIYFFENVGKYKNIINCAINKLYIINAKYYNNNDIMYKCTYILQKYN